jgi:hypothetical protein
MKRVHNSLKPVSNSAGISIFIEIYQKSLEVL